MDVAPGYIEDREFLDVREFQEKLGELVNHTPVHITKRKLAERLRFAIEECVEEFAEAAGNQDLPGMFDALLDGVYVLKGTAGMLGLPWRAGWDEVHRANMDKEMRIVPGSKRSIDAIKGPGWVPPNIEGELAAHGYWRDFWTTHPSGEISEAKCLDNPGAERDGQEGYTSAAMQLDLFRRAGGV